ncbi:MAG TPA: hypothetical protein VEW07_05820 [Solirubrobacterales bacterium]|nr:hypothetical protein [Solirubrobacterales bacterium]
MKTLRSRLRRHLSYANVMASIAVFFALGGISYAAATINGDKIVKGTVGGSKLKNGTLTSTQVKQNSLTGSVIDESSLGTVPSAQTATTATTAASANRAISADTAASATTAGNANTLDGVSAQQLLVTCPVDTELFGGMCWDEEVRPAEDWIDASEECGEAGGRLPSLSELIAYVLQPGEQVVGHNWTGDVVEVNAGKETVLTSTETATSTSVSTPTNLDYRCLFYRVN